MRESCVDTVIKVGGALIEDAASFACLVDALQLLGTRHRHGPPLLVVPGGGPFADTVREVDWHLAAGDDAAHWMAILGMDQHAHLLVARTPIAVLVESADEARVAHEAHRLPVLAPYRWLRARDPLPHLWSVTSDSIAAWIAIELGASELLLVKATTGPADAVTDPYFHTVLENGAHAGRTVRVTVTGPRALVARAWGTAEGTQGL
jgi:aspartokinase-like uncharacterized kinase